MKIAGFGEKRIAELAEYGISSVSALLSYFPNKYIDFSNLSKLDLKSKDVQSVRVVATGDAQCLFLPRFNSTKVPMKDVIGGSVFLAVWYNQPYIKKRIEKGKEYLLYGKMSPTKFGEFVVQSVKPFEESLLRPLAVYKPIGSIKTASIQTAVKDALVKTNIESVLDDTTEKKLGIIGLKEAYNMLHFPNNIQEVEIAKKRVDLDNYLKLFAVKDIILKKQKKQTQYLDFRLLKEEFESKLSFTLTSEQQKAIDEICTDMCSATIMNRLLEGDVGSGKTIVAFFALFVCAKSGYQGVLLAPTEILAKQHFERAKPLFEQFGIKVAYLCSKVKTTEKRQIIKDLENGEISILIGTHSVLGDDVVFKNLALSITDEQHRFGVEQRGKLSKKSTDLDTIVMSATPIPRSLSLVLFGDLNITTIKEKPFANAKRHTHIVPATKEKDMWKFVCEKMMNGQKVYVVCPTIYNEDMQSDISNIENISKKLQKIEYFAQNLTILHGKQKKEEQEQSLALFESGQKNLLLATTIVEVGVDVSGANILVVFSPDKFGLATLHQLRGRIGRGEQDGYCFCVVGLDVAQTAKDRLKYFSTHTDGFEIAEFDQKTRGSGNIFGTKQHGKTEFVSSFAFSLESFEEAKQIYANLDFSIEQKQNLFDLAKETYADIIKKVVLN